ncbi:MAG: hypothetical protein ACQEQE_06490 [Bacillota bacterium]
MSKFLGIDTSCYTTSIALVNEKREILFHFEKTLEVKKGKQGLRQSEAFFKHVKNLSEIYTKLSKEIDLKKLTSVSVSTKPRNIKSSYMPVFLSGKNFAKTIATTLNIPLNSFSHQEGHIMASIYKTYELLNKSFYSIHISGGTTEILDVKYINNRFKIKKIGQTLDINAGQVIDRVGVKLGLDFPCGKEFEKLANKGKMDLKYPVSVKDKDMNFSGIESYGYKNLDKVKKSDNAKSIICAIAKTLVSVIKNLDSKKPIVFTGGVSSNSYLREFFKKHSRIYFGKKEFSTDNALGIALLGEMINNES